MFRHYQWHTLRGDISVLSQNIYFLSSSNYRRLLKREPGEVYWRQNKLENWINYLENSGCSHFCLAIKKKKRERRQRNFNSLDWLSVVIKFVRLQLILWDIACAFILPMWRERWPTHLRGSLWLRYLPDLNKKVCVGGLTCQVWLSTLIG